MTAMSDQQLVDRCAMLEGELAKLKVQFCFRAGLPLPPTEARMVAIAEVASMLFGVSVPEITGESRCRDICRARFAVAWVASKTAGYSLPRIGRSLGGRDHTTILGQIRRAEEWRAGDDAYRDLTDQMRDYFTPVADREANHASCS